jgi:hypothetical protein
VGRQKPHHEKLDDLAAELERLNADTRVKDPEYEELQRWLDEARSLVAEMVGEQRGRLEIRDLLERLLADEDRLSAFDADPAVLEEGIFLKAQLTGIEGTEVTGPRFKDAEIRLTRVRGEPPESHPRPRG